MAFMATIPKQKPKYSLIKKLSSTVNAQTWEAIGIEDKIKYIIKNSNEKYQLKNEYSVLININCKNVPTAYEFFEDEESSYLVQEYVEGINANHFFKLFSDSSKIVRFKKSLHVLNEILKIINLLHHKTGIYEKVLHGDIKPSNILIGKNGQIYLIDFGSSIVFQENSKLLSSHDGTRSFSSDKLWVNGKYLSHKYNETFELHSLYLTFLDMAGLSNDSDLTFLNGDAENVRKILIEWRENQNSLIPFGSSVLLNKLGDLFKKFEYVGDLFAMSENTSNEKINIPGEELLRDDLVKLDKELNKKLGAIHIKYLTVLVFLSSIYYPMLIFISKDVFKVVAIFLVFIFQMFLLVRYFWDKQLNFKKIAKEYYLLRLVLLFRLKMNLGNKLSAIRYILKKYNFNDVFQEKQRLALEVLIDKAWSRKVNLAIVGEFSSGKSTLINALIEQELLKTSPLPTTTVSNRLTYSKKTYVQLNANKLYFEKSNDDVLKLIEKNTTQNVLENGRVTIGVNSHFLNRNIDLIDTPGANSLDDRHRRRAIETIRDEADYMLILIKATQPLTLSLKNYFKEIITQTSIGYAFVVTSIDLVPKKERNILVIDIQKRLEEFLEEKSVKVFTVSASKKLDYEFDKENVELLAYRDSFAEFTREVGALIFKSREQIIESRINNIIDESINGLRFSLEDRLFKLKEKKQNFNEIVVKDIELFKLEMKSKFQNNLKLEVTDFKFAFEQYFIKAQNDDIELVRNEIVKIENNSQFDAYFSSFMKAHELRLRYHLKSAVNLINNSINLNKLLDGAEDLFWKNYNQLKHFLNVESNEKIEVDFKFELNNEYTKDLAKLILSLSKDFSGALGVGAIAGAAVGTAIFPGVGSVVGGIVGAVLGALSGPSLSEKKAKFIQESKNIITAHYKVLHDDLMKHFEQSLLVLNTKANNRFDRLIDRYLKEVEKVNLDIRIEKNELEKIESDIVFDLKKVDKIKLG